METSDKYSDNSQDIRSRYQAYARLQTTAVFLGENLPIPEIVAIGGQSDGKSSLMEAFLGFRFNICSSEIGTRRPLFIQMVHNATANQPRCRLQNEDDDSWGDYLLEDEVSKILWQRTESHCKALGVSVSSKPIVMRAESDSCPNITIIDTPGLILKARQGEPESTPADILDMVKELTAPRHRLILFLQQSSVEWASSPWMHILQEVDPSFQRTVLVVSKFDNRLKEFTHKNELERYLEASGYLPESLISFFVALPKDKSANQTNSAHWRQAIQELDSRIKTHLTTEIQGGWDESKFGDRIGFISLARFLEKELACRYRASIPSVLDALTRRCVAEEKLLKQVMLSIDSLQDVSALRGLTVSIALQAAARLFDLMHGKGCDARMIQKYGLTTSEERSLLPGQSATSLPPFANLRLLGGSAFQRCLEEFKKQVMDFPISSIERESVANALLAGNREVDVINDLARDSARNALEILYTKAPARLGVILKQAFEAAVDAESKQPIGRSFTCILSEIVQEMEEHARIALKDLVNAITAQTAFSPAPAKGGMTQVLPETPSPEVPYEPERVPLQPLSTNQVSLKATPDHQKRIPLQRPKGCHALGDTQSINSRYGSICRQVETLYQDLKSSVVHGCADAMFKQAFLSPLQHWHVAADLCVRLMSRTDEDFMNTIMPKDALVAAQKDKLTAERKLKTFTEMKEQFEREMAAL